MIIEPKAGPTLSNPNTTDSPSQLTAKARAIETFQQSMAQNATNVTPEEMVGIRQNNNSEPVPTPESRPGAVTQAPEPAVVDEQVTSQIAQLARREKQLRLRDQQLRQREAQYRAASKPAPTFDESKYVSLEALKADPFGILNSKADLNYDKLTELVLNGPTQDQRSQIEYVKKLEARLEALEGTTASTQKTLQERDAGARASAIKQINNEVSQLITRNPDFEAINATNSKNDVTELIARTFDEDGILMTVEEAAQQVEDYLIDEAMKFNKLKKVQQRLQTRTETPGTQAQGQPKQQQLKTLTNSVSSTRQLSAKERAILAFKGELKT
jgi:hypothetical protein